MEHRRIGSLEVTVVGIGCNNFGRRIDAAATKAVVDAALDAGLVALTSGANVLRLAPPLVIESAHVDRAIEILTEVLTA